MKKTLFAIAIGATCCLAHAQSSVQIFGIVDAAFAYGRGSVANATGLASDGYNSSRLGFKGMEDLGGGNFVGFHLEGGVSTDTGAGGNTNTNNQPGFSSGGGGLTFNRKIHLTARGGWGELRLGRDYTPIYTHKSSFASMGTNGVGASQVAATNLSGTTGVRASNSIGYFLPKMAGFYGTLMHFMGENPSNAANADDGTGTGIRIGWESGPINVAIATQKTSYLAGDVKTTNAGASYDAGFALFKAMYNVDSISGGLEGKGASIGAEIPVGKHIVRTAYSYYERDAAGTPKVAKIAIGYVHNLSKRTQLYTSYAHVRNKGGSAVALNNAITAANARSSGFDLGLSHSF